MAAYFLPGGMKTAIRFRLYPNHRQEQKLLRMIEAGRQLWNDALTVQVIQSKGLAEAFSFDKAFEGITRLPTIGQTPTEFH